MRGLLTRLAARGPRRIRDDRDLESVIVGRAATTTSRRARVLRHEHHLGERRVADAENPDAIDIERGIVRLLQHKLLPETEYLALHVTRHWPAEAPQSLVASCRRWKCRSSGTGSSRWRRSAGGWRRRPPS
eukprot:2700705-Prymnesium_polylepis.1